MAWVRLNRSTSFIILPELILIPNIRDDMNLGIESQSKSQRTSPSTKRSVFVSFFLLIILSTMIGPFICSYFLFLVDLFLFWGLVKSTRSFSSPAQPWLSRDAAGWGKNHVWYLEEQISDEVPKYSKLAANKDVPTLRPFATFRVSRNWSNIERFK